MNTLRWIVMLGVLFNGTYASADCYSAVSSGGDFSCVLRTDQTVLCWGDDTYDVVTNTPATTFTQISAGYAGACGVRTTGALSCWGWTGTLNDLTVGVPAGTSYVEVSVGGNAACARKADGTLACWGNSDFGGSTPAGNYLDIDCGGQACCGVKTDHSLLCWTAVADLDGFISETPAGTVWNRVEIGQGEACALNSSNATTCWAGNQVDNHIISGAPATAFSDLSLSDEAACGIKVSDNTLQCWGDSGTVDVTTHPAGAFVDIEMGEFHACALDADGNVSCWGADWANQLTNAPAHDCTPATTTTTTLPAPSASVQIIAFIGS